MQAILISAGRQPVSGNRWRLVTGQAVGRAGGEPIAHVDLRDDGGAVLVKQRIAAGVVGVVMRVDHVFDREIGDLGDRRLDAVVQRRKLRVDHDRRVAADGQRDVAAFAGQHIGVVAEIGGLDLDLAEVALRRAGRSGRRRRRGSCRRRRLLGVRHSGKTDHCRREGGCNVVHDASSLHAVPEVTGWRD
jgi:hypothetical protein